MDNVTLHPIWRQAVRDVIEGDFGDGDVLTHAWLEEHFGMEKLADDVPLTPAAYQERQFEWLRNLEAFRTELLEKHQIYLTSVHGQGYRITPACEQTSIAQERFEREAKKSYRRAAEALKHIRLDQLNEAQRKENSDAIARLAMLRGMHRAVE
ncbi:hypothetical protein [Burkholderia gladioli]|uniref:hypothetical protein n=1 Tax=Burkholderia gladioli TaxID=28095 RepID=UPI00164009C7|nr:hypothetical protein [Burkholderia gladioli]